MRKYVLAAAALAAAVSALTSATAKADEERDFKTCIDLSTPPQQSVETCWRLIQDPEFLSAGCTRCLAQAMFSMGWGYQRLKKYDLALVAYNNALRSDASNALIYLSRGKLYSDTGKRAAAIQDYTKCLALPAGAASKTCAFNRAAQYSQMGNFAAAIRDYTIAIGFDPAFADAYANRGHMHERTGNRAAAITDYRSAIKHGFQGPDVGRRLAALEAGAEPTAPPPVRGGDPEQFRQACFNPPNPQAGIIACTRRIQAGGGATSKEQSDSYNSRAWWRYKAGQYQAGLADANRALALDPGSAPAYDTRGHIYRMLGRRDAAIGDFRQALALNPGADTRRSAQDGLRALGVAVSHPPGTPVSLTWRFRNNTGGSVQVKMYARQRGIWWPTATTNWRMDGAGPHAFTISCRAGEKVCYGAWAVGNTDRYWGAGFQDRHGCESCCYACFEGQTTLYNLNR